MEQRYDAMRYIVRHSSYRSWGYRYGWRLWLGSCRW